MRTYSYSAGDSHGKCRADWGTSSAFLLIRYPNYETQRAKGLRRVSNVRLQIRAEDHHSLGHRQQACRVPEVEHEQGGEVRVPDVVGVVLRVAVFHDLMADLEERFLDLRH